MTTTTMSNGAAVAQTNGDEQETIRPGMQKALMVIEKALMLDAWWSPPHDYKGRDSDIYITTFMKSGTTWTQQICHQIRTGGTEDFENIGDEVIMLRPKQYQHVADIETQSSRYSPRCWKSHMRCHQALALGGKHIFVVRHPVDVSMSMYHFIPPNLGIPTSELPFEDYYWAYFATTVDPKPYWRVLEEWLNHKDDKNVMFVFFEDLKKDLGAMVDKIADFMGCEITAEQKAKVLEYSEFNYMRQHERKFTDLGELERLCGEAHRQYTQTDEKLQHVGKVRSGKTGNKVPLECQKHMELMWKVHMLPLTGCDSYESFYAKHSALK